ncbi:sulfite exporter TauE/SafE family protein, partial [bacterium]|nr:sulfite exporter TauE/SafE family protein [bacterium]
FKARLHALGRHLRVDHVERFKYLQGPLTVLAGVFLGVVVTLTSVGAGALGTVMMLYLYPLRLTPSKVVGTDLAHAIPLALVAGASHWMAGNVNYFLLFSLLAGSLPGVLVGSWLSARASDTVLRPILALLLLLTGLKILLV